MPASQNIANENAKNQPATNIANSQTEMQELQKKFEIVLSEKSNLEKQNNNLIENTQSYALILKDEKKEKLKMQEKNDLLQQRIEFFMQKYYLVLGLCMVLLTMLIFLNFSEIVNSVQKVVG